MSLQLQLPQRFRDGIWRFFGDTGKRWLTDLPRLISTCTELWQLEAVNPVDDLSVNFVGFTHSRLYGPAVLKIGVPHPELYSEIQALELYNGRNICRRYAADLDAGAMLLERVIPGDDLTSIPERDTQIDIAAHFMSCLPVPIGGDYGFPTYEEWTTKAFARMRREGKANNTLLAAAGLAEEVLKKLERSDRPRMLLHGDLHHWNILKDGDSSWKVIDPKGVVDVPCLECGRFILNHISETEPEERADCLENLANKISSAIGESPRTVIECALVDFSLSRSWTLEEYLSPSQLKEALDDIERQGTIYLDYLNGEIG